MMESASRPGTIGARGTINGGALRRRRPISRCTDSNHCTCNTGYSDREWRDSRERQAGISQEKRRLPLNEPGHGTTFVPFTTVI
jgi:hypothetical protein